jgi:heavy metal sensor kinase
MNTRSLKFRLIAGYVGWLTLLFIVFGFFVHASLNHYLRQALREALARRTHQVADVVQRSTLDWEALGKEIQSHFSPEINNRFTRVLANGRITYVSGAPADHSFDPMLLPLPPSNATEERFVRRTCSDGTSLLVVMLPRNAGTNRFIIEEGSLESRITAPLHAWLAALIFGLAILVLLAVLGGYLLVQRSLNPVLRIIHSAERISSHNLSERLPVPDTRDELEQLSTALNGMIRRLDGSFRHTQRFLADASHELRTPLTILQSALENMTDRTDSTGEIHALAHTALEEIERLRRIVEALFALSRLDAGEAMEETRTFDLAELAATTADQMCLLAEDKNISVRCSFREPVMVHGDPGRLKQVVVNLLDNAIKYTSMGGDIEVCVSQQDGTAFLQVTDNGIGIPAAALPHVFERFFRVDKARTRELGGAGLGLSIVKSICDAHDGHVEVHSREGKGSRFVVALPLSPAARREAVASDRHFARTTG